eukprot:179164_1
MKKEEFEIEILQKNKNEFDKKYICKKHILKNNIITAVGYGGGSSFCKKSISSGLYQYKFKIGNINSLMIIGIWKIQKNKTPPTDIDFTYGKYQGYGFDVYLGKLTNPETGYTNDKQYGISCNNKPGTIIRMNINMNKYELSYTINDTDYGIAFKIQKAEYKVAVFIRVKG